MKGLDNEKSLFIFRCDLRLEDNTGLISALNHGGRVISCFIIDKQLLNTTCVKAKNNNAIQFTIESLRDLDQQLKRKKSRLYLFSGRSNSVIDELITKEKISAVHFNDDYTIFSRKRDEGIYKICKKKNVKYFLIHC